MPKAVWNGAVIAESDDTVVVEGNHYFPASSVNSELSHRQPAHRVCSWKGTAGLLRRCRGRRRPTRALPGTTPSPAPAAAQIKDRVAFWKGVRVEP